MTNEVYPNKSYAQLCADLVAIGIRPGDTVVDEKGAKSERHIRRHNFNRSNGAILQRYERAIDVLLREEYQTATVHGANAVLFDSVSLKARVLQKMKEDPYYFIDDPNGFYK